MRLISQVFAYTLQWNKMSHDKESCEDWTRFWHRVMVEAYDWTMINMHLSLIRPRLSAFLCVSDLAPHTYCVREEGDHAHYWVRASMCSGLSSACSSGGP